MSTIKSKQVEIIRNCFNQIIDMLEKDNVGSVQIQISGEQIMDGISPEGTKLYHQSPLREINIVYIQGERR